MSKEQELIDELQEYLDIEDTSRIDLHPEEVQMCMDALEKQIAKKPLDVNVTELKSGVWIDLLCPTCEQSIVGQPYRPNYCKHCGQKLD